MKFADERPDLGDGLRRLFEIGGIFARFRIEPDVLERRRQDVVGRIQHVDAAILEAGQDREVDDEDQLSIFTSGPKIFAAPLLGCNRSRSCPRDN